VDVVLGTGLANPFETYRNAAGGQPVELQTLASYLGSSAHLVVALLALDRHPELPTGLVDTGGLLREYVAGLPAVVHKLGRALQAGLGTTVAVEFPVYWCGLVGNKFVHSRIDALTRNRGSCDVWEFKTKWGRQHERPPFGDIRQAVLYCYMFKVQTGVQVRRFHLRYASVSPSGIAVVTHTYQFSGLQGFLDEALGRTDARP